MDREVCRPLWVRAIIMAAVWTAVWSITAPGFGVHRVLAEETVPPPSVKGDPPWVILQIARRDLIPLDRFQIVAGKSVIGVTSGEQVQRLFAHRTADGKWATGAAPFEDFDRFGGRVRPGRIDLDQPVPERVAAPYLLLNVQLAVPVATTDLPVVDGGPLAGFRVVDPQGKAEGELVGWFSRSARNKVLVFAGSWHELDDLALVGPEGHRDDLVSEAIPFPYRYLELTPNQILRIEGIVDRYAWRLADARARYALAGGPAKQTLRAQMDGLRQQLGRAIESQLTARQAEMLQDYRRR